MGRIKLNAPKDDRLHPIDRGVVSAICHHAGRIVGSADNAARGDIVAVFARRNRSVHLLGSSIVIADCALVHGVGAVCIHPVDTGRIRRMAWPYGFVSIRARKYVFLAPVTDFEPSDDGNLR